MNYSLHASEILIIFASIGQTLKYFVVILPTHKSTCRCSLFKRLAGDPLFGFKGYFCSVCISSWLLLIFCFSEVFINWMTWYLRHSVTVEIFVTIRTLHTQVITVLRSGQKSTLLRSEHFKLRS